MKKKIMLISTLLFLTLISCNTTPILSENSISIPIKGNTYVTSGFNDANVTHKGIQNWSGTQATLSSWFKTSNTGLLNLFLNSELPKEPTTLNIIIDNQDFIITLNKDTQMPIFVGKIDVDTPKYIRIDMHATTSNGDNPKIIEWLVDGEATMGKMTIVRDFEPYWGMRGPSVHMSYTLPDQDVEFFYNEITVPEGEDKIGSYFMTNGFGEGYCGIQVNSDTERRILFSVWSPFVTDDPKSIPEDERIIMLEKGENVTVGEFGNEGSGGQSYRVYNWKANQTYKLMTRVRPNGDNSTTYTAWFFNPEVKEWEIIASFKRPKTDTWYKRPHSFLENFIPSQGYLGRSVQFSNQWACTSKGKWIELTEGKFTYDATAAAGVRMDYAGGIKNNSFYLQNGGFFNTPTEYATMFKREPTGVEPTGVFN